MTRELKIAARVHKADDVTKSANKMMHAQERLESVLSSLKILM